MNDTVTIPRAQYEALMGAAEALRQVKHDYASCGAPMTRETAIMVNRAIAMLFAAKIQTEAALRSAGIEETR